MFDEPGSAREEAERLVAVVLAAASMAANANPRLSTGSAECCVCPLCKVIAAVRDPDPAVVERLTSGAGDLAAGVASFMRNVAGSNRDSWHTATRSAAEDTAPQDPTSAAATGWPDSASATASAAHRMTDHDSTAAAKAKATQAGRVTLNVEETQAAQANQTGAKKPMAKKAIAKKTAEQAMAANAQAPGHAATRPAAASDGADKDIAAKGDAVTSKAAKDSAASGEDASGDRPKKTVAKKAAAPRKKAG